MSNCTLPEFVGVPQETLQSWLAACQQALQELTIGGKLETAAYAQGDGSKSVTYTRADIAALRERTRALAAALGLSQRRHAMRVVF